MRRDIIAELKNRVLVYDGAMGSMLMKKGLLNQGSPEKLNIDHSSAIKDIHDDYLSSGCDIIETNTFGGNKLSLSKYGLENRIRDINIAGVTIAKSACGPKKYVAASVGPLPEMLEPLGLLTFDQAKNIFKEQIKYLIEGTPDIILLETFSDILELKAAVIAVRELSDIPIQAQLTYTDAGTTLSGTTPESAAVILDSLGVDVIGVNCSLGPEEIFSVVKRLADAVSTDTYLSVLPNAGLPEIENGKTIYKYPPEKFAEYAYKFYELGFNLIGGCCGTTPEYIKKISIRLENKQPVYRKELEYALRLSSRTQVITINQRNAPYIIGERINPTRRKVLKEELRKGRTETVTKDAIEQVNAGADLLDVNVSIPDTDERSIMKLVIQSVQNVVNNPLVIDSSDPEVIEEALKVYAGKALINSVNGEEDKLKKIIPLAKKYGAGIIGLTLDDSGIPMSVDIRMKIAEKIIDEGKRNGIDEEDIIIDFLTLTCGAQPESTKITIECLNQARDNNIFTVLGVSNISFGLPDRKKINTVFLSMAVGSGLTCAIINPIDREVSQTFNSIDQLFGKVKKKKDKSIVIERKYKSDIYQRIYEAVLRGEKDNIEKYLTDCLQKDNNPIKVNKEILIPALKEVGDRFEDGRYFLPQLLLSAETMEIAVGILEKNFTAEQSEKKAKVIMATVKGDMHDIGKNIVATVLRNYGYQVLDLGKDVTTDEIIKSAIKHKVDIIGLSALMTTTMGQMETVIKELKKHGINAFTIIGGAVVSRSYAKKIGANAYAKDAIDAVKILDNMVYKK